MNHQAQCRSIWAAAASHTHLQLVPIEKHLLCSSFFRGGPGGLPDCPPTGSIPQESCPNWASLSCIKTDHGCSSNADCLGPPGQAMWAFTGPAINTFQPCLGQLHGVITGVGSPPRPQFYFTHNTTLCLDLYPSFRNEHTTGLLNCYLLLESFQDQSRLYSGEREF